jgi:hypothetical protein
MRAIGYHRDHNGNCVVCSYVDGKPGWYCRNCGKPLPRPTFPRVVTIRNIRNNKPHSILLTGKIKGGELIHWPDGQVDVITL